jgi:hypothetical protein
MCTLAPVQFLMKIGTNHHTWYPPAATTGGIPGLQDCVQSQRSGGFHTVLKVGRKSPSCEDRTSLDNQEVSFRPSRLVQSQRQEDSSYLSTL